MKRTISILTVITLLFTLAACAEKPESDSGGAEIADIANNAIPGDGEPVVGSTAGDSDDDATEPSHSTTEPSSEPTVDEHGESDGTSKNPQVTIEMEGGGKIVAELYPDKAPNTVASFISLINSGYYDGLTFHRVIPGFVIQGGDPNGDGSGGPGYTIKGEFTNNRFENDAKHLRGSLSMARTAASMDSAGSQFFICHAAAPSLDGDYAVFGRVLSGMDVVETIVNAETVGGTGIDKDMPITKQTMKSVTVDTFGVEYPEPEVIK